MADYAAEDAAYKAAFDAEWGTYVADGPIHIGNARAFNDGDPVPASTVARFNLDTVGQVRKASDPRPDPVAAQVTAPPEGNPIILSAVTEPPPDLVIADPEPAVDASTAKK